MNTEIISDSNYDVESLVQYVRKLPISVVCHHLRDVQEVSLVRRTDFHDNGLESHYYYLDLSANQYNIILDGLDNANSNAEVEHAIS